MIKSDKRICELWLHAFYLYYTMSNVHHNHAHFLLLPELLQTKYNYDGALIAQLWKEFLTTNPTPPTDDEMLYAMIQNSKLFRCSPRLFNPFYKLKGKNRRIKINSFRELKIQLIPKIHHETFHDHLYLFIREVRDMFVCRCLTNR